MGIVSAAVLADGTVIPAIVVSFGTRVIALAAKFIFINIEDIEAFDAGAGLLMRGVAVVSIAPANMMIIKAIWRNGNLSTLQSAISMPLPSSVIIDVAGIIT